MIGSMVRDRIEVRIVDAYSRAMSVAETIEAARALDPDIVGIGLPFSFSEKPAVEIAEGLKRFNNELPIVLGGIQATLNADAILRNPAVDAVVMGEGERTISDVMDLFLKGGFEEVRRILRKDCA